MFRRALSASAARARVDFLAPLDSALVVESVRGVDVRGRLPRACNCSVEYVAYSHIYESVLTFRASS